MSFSSIHSRHDTLSPSRDNDKKSGKDHKKKMIKKGRKPKIHVLTAQKAESEPSIDNFIAYHAQSYFQQSKQEAWKKCLEAIRSSVHTKNIFGDDEDVFGLGRPQQSSQMATQYLNLCKNLQQGKLYQLKLKRKGYSKWNTCIIQQESPRNEKIILLDKLEEQMIQKRAEVMPQVDEFLDKITEMKPEVVVDPLSKEIITLCKLNTVEENHIQSQIINILTQQNDIVENYMVPQARSLQLQNQYCRIIILKNLRLGLSDIPIDYLNYFRQAEIRQQSADDDQPLPLLQDIAHFRNYLKIRKPKPNKPQSLSLKTSCSACISNCSQSSNQLVRCPQCGIRIHKLCHSFQRKCGKCTYIRKTNQEKSNRPYCCLCLRDKEHGLSLQIIGKGSQQFYAHTFCLLFTNNWKIIDQEVIYSLPDLSEVTEICQLCHHGGGIVVNSKCCKSSFHPLCAFLEGYTMELPQDGNIAIMCCDCRQRKRVKFDRHFRLNFCKLLYKQTEEILKIIERD